MPRLRCKAFVLRSVRYGENRRMLDLLGENDRLISISAAAGRGRSGAAALSQAFVFGEFELYGIFIHYVALCNITVYEVSVEHVLCFIDCLSVNIIFYCFRVEICSVVEFYAFS